MKTRSLFLILAAALALATGLGWFLGARSALSTPAADAQGRKILYWYDPMEPGVRFDKPGKSPFMDMELVPFYADEASPAAGPPIVTVRPEIANSLGIRTATVSRARPGGELNAQGYVVADARGMAVLLDVFDRDAAWLKPGIPATVRIAERPGREWRAVVESVTADLDVAARSLKARVRVQQPDRALEANLLAQVAIRAPAAAPTLVVPREALIRTATRNVVVLALGDGRFQPVDVAAGAESGEFVEIKRGLKEGDRIVVSGQFLIDSEASLRAALTRMETPAAEAGEHRH